LGFELISSVARLQPLVAARIPIYPINYVRSPCRDIRYAPDRALTKKRHGTSAR
jgi:hypothetical protein